MCHLCLSVCVLSVLSWQNYIPLREGDAEAFGWKWTDCIFFSRLAREAQAGLWKQHSQGKNWQTSNDIASNHCGVSLLFAIAFMLNLTPSPLSILSCCLWQMSESYFFFSCQWVSELLGPVTVSCESLLASLVLCSRPWPQAVTLTGSNFAFEVLI